MTERRVLVIGSGIAGLTFALEAADRGPVVLITKKARAESNTNYAQGGIAAVFGGDDSFGLHRADTFVAGAGLCHPDAVGVLVEEGPKGIRELIRRGVQFTLSGEALSLGREGGHSRRRIVRADDLTGREIERALLARLGTHPNIEALENHAAVDLALDQHGRCCGAWVLDPAGELRRFPASAVMLATGGAGEVYRHTTNPAIATGDGVAMAYRAGAVLANLEFVQFHPTALYPAEGRAFLISEAVRGEGAVLRTMDGEDFMRRYHPLASLAPRDIVARAIDREMKKRGDPFVWLDCTGLEADELRARFPNILAETARRGLDILTELIPVVPAAHYQCGGVMTDTEGRTSIAGLLAAGEAACTGVHGANRLASNSLLEAVVYACRAARTLQFDGVPDATLWPELAMPHRTNSPEQELQRLRHEIKDAMWDYAGIVRSDGWLAEAADRLCALQAEVAAATAMDADGVELRNLAATSVLIVRAAQSRRESRGLHFNTDHPRRDNEHFLRDTLLSR